MPAVENADVFNPCLLLHMGPQGVPLSLPVTGCGCEKFVMPATGPAPAPPPASCPAASPAAAAASAQYGPGAMAAVAIILLLVGLGLGFCGGKFQEKRSGGGGHRKLVEEISMT